MYLCVCVRVCECANGVRVYTSIHTSIETWHKCDTPKYPAGNDVFITQIYVSNKEGRPTVQQDELEVTKIKKNGVKKNLKMV